MEKHELDKKITEVSKSILYYCSSRTSSHQDAEDLAQDIIVEIIKSSHNIRDDKAFYGFMWAVAGNIYKQWCRKKLKVTQYELTDDIYDDNNDFAKKIEDNSDINLLRRELSLLYEKYRRAAILYYLEDKSCAEISKLLEISESTVKYLLFKSRKILKEGMNMERYYGEQSYNPKKLTLLFWGNGCNRYYKLCEKKIPQNILMACYNDSLSMEEISLQIGVPMAYLEDEIEVLLEHDVLIKQGNKYSANIVIFTEDFTKEVNIKAADLQNKLAEIVTDAVMQKEDEVRNLGFVGNSMSHNIYVWQMTSLILYQSIVEKLQGSIKVEFPKTKFGDYAFVWGSECFEGSNWDNEWNFGISDTNSNFGDYMQCMDFQINGEMVHKFLFSHKAAAAIYFDIAKGKTDRFSENDLECIAEMIKNGYVRKEGNHFSVNCPIYTKEQFDKLLALFDDVTNEVCEKTKSILDTVTKILLNHTPSHLKNIAKSMAYLRLFEDAVSSSARIMYQNDVIKQCGNSGILPTTYIRLAK